MTPEVFPSMLHSTAGKNNGLLPRHRADLYRSRLSAAPITAARLRTVRGADEALATLRWPAGAWRHAGRLLPALAVPFFDAHGRPVPDFLRLRPDHPRKDKGGKAIRYEQPRGVPV